MKKTSAMTINLKPIRIPLLFCAFLSVILVCTILAKSFPSVSLNEDFIPLLLSPNISYKITSPPLFSVCSIRLSSQKKKEDSEVVIPKTEIKPAAIKSEKVNPPAVINNQTALNIKSEDYLSPSPSFLKENLSVLIVHTHTTESYTPSEKFSYTPTDIDRTTDKNFNMVRVGKEIKNVLSENGIRVFHDTTINDFPSYSGSYNRSAKIIENYIKKTPSVKIVLDVHRDAIEEKNGKKIKYTTKINNVNVAKIMFVVGSSDSGLSHENWEENLRFALQLQNHINSSYPELCRPINFRSQRFNQQLSPGSIIVEIGTNGNTLDEALLGARYFAEGLADFIEKNKGL